MTKPQGYPFLFFGHDPPLADGVSPTYALSFAEAIPFHSGRHLELAKAFRERLARGSLEGELTFDPQRPRVAVAKVTRGDADAKKQIAAAMLAIHGVHAIEECVCLSSRGAGASKWDAQSRAVQSEPTAALLSLEANASADDARLAEVVPEAPRAPFGLKVIKAIAPAPPQEFLYRSGVVLRQRDDRVEVVADLLGFPSRLTGAASATVGVLDGERLVVTMGSVAVLLARSRGLFRAVSACPLPESSFHAAAGLGRLAIVGSAYGPQGAAIALFGAVGLQLKPLARQVVDGEAFGSKSEVSALVPVIVDERIHVEAEFSSKGRRLQSKKVVELVDLPRVPADVSTDSDLYEVPEGASTATRLPDGGWLALFADVPALEGTVHPARRRVVRIRPDGARVEYDLPPGAYVGVAASPDGRRFFAGGGHAGPSLIADVESGAVEWIDVNASFGQCVFLDDDHLLLRTGVLDLRTKTTVQRWPAPWPVAVELGADGTMVRLQANGSVETARISDGATVSRAPFTAAALRTHEGEVQAMVDGAWRVQR